MTQRTIELIQEEGTGYWTVVGDGLIGDRLGPDEALWTVAHLLMKTPGRYLHTYEQWLESQNRWFGETLPKPIALLEDLRVRAECLPPVRARVSRTFDELGQLVNRVVVPR